MTDAREIIAQEFRLAHRDTCYPDASDDECEIAASVIVASLTAAGFRIIGPDEVDQVTLEKAVDAATDAYANNDDWDYFNSAEVSITDAIRAIGRKA